MKTNPLFKIYFGAMAEPISKQLSEQGYGKYCTNESKMQQFENIKESITNLYFNDILNDFQTATARNKLAKQILNYIQLQIVIN